MRHLIEQRGLQDRVEVDSAGTGGWHVGEGPDLRATKAAQERGISLAGSARQVGLDDFERFDLILAMDNSNISELLALAPGEASRGKVRLLREFDLEARESGDLEVPDPYYGGPEGFQQVIDLVQAACEGVLDSLGLGEAA